MISEEVESLMLRALTETATPQEEKLLEEWRVLSQENRKISDDYLRIFELKESEPVPSFDPALQWEKLIQRIGETSTSSDSISLTFWLRIAASILLVAASIFIIREKVGEREIVHESGDRVLSFKLHDGTTIWMKPNATLTHTSAFNSEDRAVRLSGEAFFDVTSDPHKPFTIVADQSHIQVVGTSFMVKADPARKENSVEVRQGIVTLALNQDRAEAVRLSAGMKGVLDKSSLSINTNAISTDNILAWKDRKLIFRKTPVEEVIEVVESYFQVEIDVPNDELLKCRFTSTFDDPEIAEVMEALSVSLNIDVVMKDGRYLFDGEGCP